MITPALIALTFKTSHIAIGISRVADSRFVSANDAFLKLFGFERPEVIGSTSLELGMWPIPAQRETMIAQLNRGEAVAAYEAQYRTKAGHVGFVLISASLLDHENEKYMVGLLTDITSRKTAETALQESEERFRLFMQNSPTVAWIKDEHGRMIYLSKTHEDRFGLRLADVFGKTDAELWPEDTASEFRENDLKVLTAGKPITVIEQTTAPNGHITHWLSTKFPFADQSGIRFVGGIGLDITDHMKAQMALHDHQERLELALAGSNLGYWDWHIQTGQVKFDARWCAILGYREHEMPTEISVLEHLLNPADKSQLDEKLNAHFQGNTETFQNEHRLRHKDGHWVWIFSSGKVLDRDADGNALRMAGTTLDISRRKRLNDEGLELLQRMEALMREAASGSMQQIEADTRMADDSLASLSRRQRQLLEMIAKGMTSAEIAKKLKIATATAISHRRALMEKLDLHSTAEVTRYAIDHKVIASDRS